MLKTILLTSLLFPITLAPKGEWLTIRAEKERFSFQMPANPAREVKQVHEAEFVRYNLQLADFVYGVSYVDMKFTTIESAKKQYPIIYQNMKDGTLKSCTCKLLEEKIIQNDDKYKAVIKYEFDAMGTLFHYYKYFYFYGANTFQMTIGARTDQLDRLEKEKEKFFASLHPGL